MFDHGIIIDYSSTDRSVEICKQICPTWTIVQTRNASFEASEIDKEFMDIESTLNGIKVVLNTTEFLFCKRPIKEVFSNHNSPVSLSVRAVSPYSLNEYNPTNLYDLLHGLLNTDVVYNDQRGNRQIHNYMHGNYGVGRHTTSNPQTTTEEMHLVWLGYYPLNDRLLERKLQIQNNIPQSDRLSGAGYHHIVEKDELLAINVRSAKGGQALFKVNENLYNLLDTQLRKKTYVVTGGCGFIGSHMTDKLVSLGHRVIVIDNMLSGNMKNLNKEAIFIQGDICSFDEINTIFKNNTIDGVFHFAAIARTPWCIDDPILAYKTNVMGTLHILEAARNNNIKRVVLSSSNVVYAFLTPYRTSKEAVEDIGSAYSAMYNMSVISLRYSNVYGKRQSEEGPSPNVFAALRKSKKDNGCLIITGDGTQTRNYTHVSDIVNGNLLAMFSRYCGAVDLCTGVSISLNEVSKYFDCPVKYIDERPGDVKHIIQSPEKAFSILGWSAQVSLEDGIKDVL
jgi:UDP-glucose 4-epimerase